MESQSHLLEREYIRQVLGRVEQTVEQRYGAQARQTVAKVFAQVLQCTSADEIAEGLYHREDYRQFALRLMWLLRLVRLDGTTPGEAVMANEIENLVLCLAPLFQDPAGANSCTPHIERPFPLGIRQC